MTKNIQEVESGQNPASDEFIASPLAPYTRVLVVVCVLLGLGIIVGTIVVAGGILDRLGGRDNQVERAENKNSALERRMSLPQGQKLRGVSVYGRDLMLEIGDQTVEQIWIFNPATGAVKSQTIFE